MLNTVQITQDKVTEWVTTPEVTSGRNSGPGIIFLKSWTICSLRLKKFYCITCTVAGVVFNLPFRSPLLSCPMEYLVCSVWFILQFTDISHCYYSIVLKGFSNLYLQPAVIFLIHTSWKGSNFVWNSLIRVKLGPTVGHAIKQMGYPNLCVHSWYALVIDKKYMAGTQHYKKIYMQGSFYATVTVPKNVMKN